MKNYLSLFLILSVFGCTRQNELSKENIAYSPKCEKIDFSDYLKLGSQPVIYNYVDSVILIPLETKDESVLSDIRRIKVTDSYIYVLDGYRNGSLAIFDRQGHYVKRLPIGGGPQELNTPMSFVFNEQKKELWVHQPNYIKKYTENGDFISEHLVSFAVASLEINNDELLVGQVIINDPSSSYLIARFDSCFNLIGYHMLPNERLFTAGNRFARRTDGSVCFHRDLDNNIYSLADDTIFIDRTFSDQDIFIDDQGLHSVLDYDYYHSMEREGKVAFVGFCETDNYEKYHFSAIDQIHLYRNKRTGLIIGEDRQSDWDISIVDSPSIYRGSYKNFFVAQLSYIYLNGPKGAENLYLTLEANKKILSPEQMEMLKNLTDETNPIIMLYSLKDPE